MSKAIFILGTVSGALILSGCNGSKGAKAAWSDVISKCAQTSLNGKEILYFGPSNAIGPGSIWRKDAQGVFRLRYDLSQMPDPKNFMAPYTEVSCDGKTTRAFTFKADAGLDAVPVSAELKADLAKARKVEAKATSIAWVPVAEGPFQSYVRSMPADAGPRVDLDASDKFVLTRALKVRGFSTSLEFSSDVAAGLKGKYNGSLPAGLAGDVSGGLNASWKSANTLTLTSAGDFYIAGEFQPYSPTGFASGSDAFGPVVNMEGVEAAIDRR